MVEKQAIGRVVRLDQRNPVRITRYIMRDTVEEVCFPFWILHSF